MYTQLVFVAKNWSKYILNVKAGFIAKLQGRVKAIYMAHRPDKLGYD